MAVTSATSAMRRFLSALAKALAEDDAKAAAGLFAPDAYWRDLVSFTWNIRTMEGRPAIKAMIEACLPHVKPRNFKIDGKVSQSDGIAEAWIIFETAVARGRGHVRLKGDKCTTLLTTMAELKGHEEKTGEARDPGVVHGAELGRKTYAERRAEELATLGVSTQPYCVIIGGGQGGIALGARLRRLGVPTIIIEKNPRAGDSWRNRYKSLCLHDPVWYDHLPYLPFPDDWPVFAPKDKIGDWLESYTKIMELNYWSSTVCDRASYDEAKGEWTLHVTREGRPMVLHPKQLVLATGMSAVANMPDYPGQASFKGIVVHSSQHKGSDGWKGRTCVVIGSNNSAHDICADLYEHGADVTMVQRSSTLVARSSSLMELGLAGLYSEAATKAGITTDKADMIFASVPYGMMAETQKPIYEAMKIRDASLYERLKAVGFSLDFGEDGSGLFMKYLRRGSGYYIDVGASELIASGKIKLKSGKVREIKPNGVVMADGTHLPADLIVFATGYSSMNGWAERLISKDVADKVGKCWGLGSSTTKDPGPWEGELRNMWKPTHQPGLWFHGGNLHQSRHYSQFLSLQLKARMEKIATPVYGMMPVHHRA